MKCSVINWILTQSGEWDAIGLCEMTHKTSLEMEWNIKLKTIIRVLNNIVMVNSSGRWNSYSDYKLKIKSSKSKEEREKNTDRYPMHLLTRVSTIFFRYFNDDCWSKALSHGVKSSVTVSDKQI